MSSIPRSSKSSCHVFKHGLPHSFHMHPNSLRLNSNSLHISNESVLGDSVLGKITWYLWCDCVADIAIHYGTGREFHELSQIGDFDFDCFCVEGYGIGKDA
jgi:hypothetical protein